MVYFYYIKHNIFLYAGAGVIGIFLLGTITATAETLSGVSEKNDIEKPVPTLMMAEGQNESLVGTTNRERTEKGESSEVSTEDGVARMMEDGVLSEDADEGGSVKGAGSSAEEKERGLENAMMRANENAEDGLSNAELHVNIRALMMRDKNTDASQGVDISDADEVHSSADFEHFVAHKAKGDVGLTDVDIKNGKVEITHDFPMKFLGFWGTTVSAVARGDEAGNVELDYPWYAMFMKRVYPTASVLKSLQSEIDTDRDTFLIAPVTGTSSARTYAIPHVFDSMMKALGKVSMGD